MITLNDVRSNPNFQLMIERACDYLTARGYTEHGMRHVTYVANTTAAILAELGFDARTVELGAIAGYLHDIGNMHNRKHHSVTGANLVFMELREMGMDLAEICEITTAIANHEEEIGKAVTPITAALIIADKSDAHRTRVNRAIDADQPGMNIHDRVNLAITDSQVSVDASAKTITLEIQFDQSSCQIMDYFEIYLNRMNMCKEAAAMLGCRFRLVINGLELLGHLGQHPQLKKAGA
ncbi:MAG: HDIG domain-containing metalloprotein [Limnochordia bacterium]|jgi:putative nucleotidyltransferase with HDIG domain|nr:HD domain-containing protein [Limnochordia bacterium]